ncbi:MAG TPA: SET domain-containing protein [Candidatus Paceibacterota bacterium]
MKEANTNLPDNSDLVVANSTVLENQFGVITKKSFNKGEVIFSVKGPVLSQPTKYSFSVGIDKHIDPLRDDGSFDFGHYLNHSCDPNTIIRVVNSDTSPHIEIVARRDIKSGEELAFDYASSEYNPTTSKTSCLCKTDTCRGVMHGFKDLPEEIKEKYSKEGMIPDYLITLSKT